MSPEPADEAFQRRFDLARLVLERKYRWARLTLRSLQPVRREQGTLAVDRYLRLYHGPRADTWTDKEFLGALWHEVNHILRHHPDRLEHLPAKYHTSKTLANIAGDLEINDDLASQGMVLPAGLLYSPAFGHPLHVTAEQHFLQFVADAEESPEPPEGGSDPNSGEGGDSKPQDQPSKPPKLPEPDNDPECGSGSGGDSTPDELPPPTPEDLARLDRTERKQAEDIVTAAADERAGISQSIHDAAVARLGRSLHDWRRTFATEVRNAIEQRADEAEEYTFRRRSRRATFADSKLILPGSFRPIPALGVVVDVSGSMDKGKLEAAMREVHGILERLAIPAFTAYPTNSQTIAEITVTAIADVQRVFEYVGGGTNMMAGIQRAISRGAEVVVVLTDAQCSWDRNGPQGIPVIIGGINRNEQRAPTPRWARLVDVERKEA